MTRSKITISQWAKAIQEHFAPAIPSGFQSVSEIMPQIGKSHSRTSDILRSLHAAGKADRVLVKSRPYYRLK
jgi:hypothetical protein